MRAAMCLHADTHTSFALANDTTRHGALSSEQASEPSPDRDGRLSSIINSLNRIAVFEDTHTHTKTLKRARRSGGLKIGRCSNSLDAFFLFSFSTAFHKVHTCVDVDGGGEEVSSTG